MTEKKKGTLFAFKGLPYLLLALAAGVLLLVLPSREKDTEAATPSVNGESYRKALENELTALLNRLDGVKNCSVVLTLEQGYTYLYATDQKVTEQDSGKQYEKTVVLANQNGKESPVLLRETPPVVSGVAVVCPNADEFAKERIRALLCSLLGLEKDRIGIQT